MNELTTTNQGKGITVFGQMTPRETVEYATEIANALAPVIEKQNMFSVIQGKKHPKIEAWLTLGAILGILPREKSVSLLSDGSYEAEIELIATSTGHIVAGASAICGIEEKRWSNAERYARRSMAVTRATGKAYRLAFSWIIQLAGYQPTPAEEMPDDVIDVPQRQVSPKQAEQKKPHLFDFNSATHQDILAGMLRKDKVDDALWESIGKQLHGKPLADYAAVKQEVFTR